MYICINCNYILKRHIDFDFKKAGKLALKLKYNNSSCLDTFEPYKEVPSYNSPLGTKCQNLYFELDIEQDAIHKLLLVKQETE